MLRGVRKHKESDKWKGQRAKFNLWVVITNHLKNHLEDFPQRLKAYQDFLGSPDFCYFHVNTQSFPHICCQAHRAVKSPSRRVVIEKLVAFIN